MTIEEMHASILLKVDRVGSYSTANLIPGEIDDFINDAVDDFIDQQRQVIRSYRYNERAMEAQENLRTLINRASSSNITPTSILGEEGWEVSISEFNDFDYFISGTATLNGNSEVLRHVLSSYLTDSVRGKTLNFFKRGIPISVESSTIVGFLPRDRSSIPTEVNINYLSYPQSVKLDPNNSSNNVDVNLPDHTHRDIVELAAQKILQSLSGQQQTTQE